MANGYKAPKGLSSAVRGRSMVRRDYTAGLKREAADRQATLGLVQSIAGGVAAASSAIGENVESWDKAEAGAKEVFESSGIEGSFDESGYKGADNWMDRWFKSAGEVSDTQIIGDREFSTSNLIEIGSVDSVTASKMADRTYDDLGNPTGRMSLYESEGRVLESGVGGMTTKSGTAEVMYDELIVLGGKPDKSDGSTVIENNIQQQKKENAVTPKNNKKETMNDAGIRRNSNEIDFSSIESVATPSLSQVDNKDNNKFAFTYKGEEVDFSDFFSNLFGKKPEQTEDAIVAERLKRMKEGSLSTSP